MSFSIEIIKNSKINDEDGFHCTGKIQINEFEENFLIALGYWDSSDYIRQWNNALKKLFISQHEKSCLITSITDPTNTNYMFWWPLYRDGEIVHIQNCVLFLDRLKILFDPYIAYKFIPKRKIISEDGDKISEWTISIEEIHKFLINRGFADSGSGPNGT